MTTSLERERTAQKSDGEKIRDFQRKIYLKAKQEMAARHLAGCTDCKDYYLRQLAKMEAVQARKRIYHKGAKGSKR